MARNIYLEVFDKYFQFFLDRLQMDDSASLYSKFMQKELLKDDGAMQQQAKINSDQADKLLESIKNSLQDNRVKFMEFLDVLREYAEETTDKVMEKHVTDIYRDIAILASELPQQNVQDFAVMKSDTAPSSNSGITGNASDGSSVTTAGDMKSDAALSSNNGVTTSASDESSLATAGDVKSGSDTVSSNNNDITTSASGESSVATAGDTAPSNNNGVTTSASDESRVATAGVGSLETAEPKVQDMPAKPKGSKRKQDGGKSIAKPKRPKLDTSDAETDGEMTNYQKIAKGSPAYAIIINNQKFGKENRDGSEKDVKSIKQLKQINISVEHTLTDLTADEMVGALKYLATKDPESVSTLDNAKGALKLLNTSEEDIKSYKNIDEMKGCLKGKKNRLRSFEKYSCLMVFILTHGSEGGVLKGRDSSDTTVEKLAEIFNSEQCKDLRNKPKLFFIQACRGGNVDEMKFDQGGDQDRNNDKDDGTTSFRIPKDADFLFVYATPEGYKALRNPKKGSPFIQTLVSVLQTGQCNHLEEALLSVKHKVAQETFKLTDKQVKMMPSVVSQMRGKIEFDSQ